MTGSSPVANPRHGHPSAARALVTPRPVASPRLRIVCLPFAGGGTAVYRPWAGRFGPDVEVSALQLPGREQRFRMPLLTTIDEMVDEAVDALLPLAGRPIVLFGHSMGAVVGYETALRLADRHEIAPAALVVSGRSAPGRAAPDRVAAHRLSDAEFVAHLRALGGTPAEVLADPELMQLVLPIVRADFRAIETWRPASPARALACPILALGGDRDPDVPAEALAAWSSFTRARFETETFAGDHFFLMPAEAAVIARIGRFLADLGLGAPVGRPHARTGGTMGDEP